MKKLKFVILLLPILLAFYFLTPGSYQMISPEDLNQKLQTQEIFLVDVHVPKQKHIKGTDLFVPYNRVEEHIAKFPQDRSTPIYLYCEGDPMGNAAARELSSQGYTEIYNLEGGTIAWREAGFSFEP